MIDHFRRQRCTVSLDKPVIEIISTFRKCASNAIPIAINTRKGILHDEKGLFPRGVNRRRHLEQNEILFWKNRGYLFSGIFDEHLGHLGPRG
jgi:hypothetical protein